MKAIIEKQVTILPANSGFVSKSDTGREPCIVKLRKECNSLEMSVG